MPIEFIWSSEKISQEVILSCSYLNWSKTYLTKPEKNSKLVKYILPLPQGEYEYKFIVDGKGCIMENQPKNINKDKNNTINNLITVKKTEKNNSSNDTDLSDKSVKNINNKNCKKEIEIYDCSKNATDFNLCTPTMSQLYDKLFEFKDENEIIRDSYSKMHRDSVPNVFINHVMIMKKNKKNTYSTYSITSRTKKKMATIVYYQPLLKK